MKAAQQQGKDMICYLGSPDIEFSDIARAYGIKGERVDGTEQLRPAIQRAIWDHLRQNVYRITTIVPPHYRIAQSYVHAGANPYCRFPGYCSYEAKTAWMTDKAPSRKFEKFAQ